MTAKELAEKWNLFVAAGKSGLDRRIQGGYSGDLLSETIANAPEECVWLTVQGHQNIVPVAILKSMAAIVLTSGHEPDDETREKADEEGVPILLWAGSTYDLAGRLYAAGVTNADGE